MKKYFMISDQFICLGISQQFCLKTTTDPGDFVKEIRMNGYVDELDSCEGEMMMCWNSDKWRIFCILFLFAPFVKQSRILFVWEEEERGRRITKRKCMNYYFFFFFFTPK